MRTAVAIATSALLLALLPAGNAGAEYSWPGRARYSVPKSKMDNALACRRGRHHSPHGAAALDGSGRKHPVLLVHGTGATREQNWEWNYWPVLRERGWEVCWVQLPHVALRDIQISSEYVARAVQIMHRATRTRIDVIGHSQGGLQPRWALKWFPSGRFVADYIALATPNHGTIVADQLSQDQGCFPSCWQMRRKARFIAALNRSNETPGGIRYTSIYTQADELVQPTGTQALRGGASNILLQDLCPGRPVDHVGIAADYVTWKLVRDALLHPGPAHPRVVKPDDCARDRMPGADEPPTGAAELVDFTREGEYTDHEPRLKPYARP